MPLLTHGIFYETGEQIPGEQRHLIPINLFGCSPPFVQITPDIRSQLPLHFIIEHLRYGLSFLRATARVTITSVGDATRSLLFSQLSSTDE